MSYSSAYVPMPIPTLKPGAPQTVVSMGQCSCNGIGSSPTYPLYQQAVGEPTNFDDMSTGGKVVVGGLVLALIGGLGWLAYKKTQLYHEIAKKEGSTGVLKLTAADTASHMLLRR